jgi:hypothetical protein
MAFSRAPKRWKSEGARSGLYGGWGGKVHPSFIITHCLFNLCMIMYCHVNSGFQQHLCAVKFSRNTSAWFQEFECANFVCGNVLLKLDFSNIYMQSDSPEMLLQGFKTLNMPVSVGGLYMWYNVYQNHPFFIQEKNVYDFAC